MQETEDIVTRLREFGCCLVSHPVANGTIERTEEAGELLIQAATTIATLRAEVEGLRAVVMSAVEHLDGGYVIPPASSHHKAFRAAIDAAKADKEGA